jgi:cell division septation protein DedD
MAAGPQIGDKENETEQQVRDTEITLSTGKLLGIFFALAIVCGVFFTMGYLLGKSTSAGGRTEIVASVPSSGSTAGKPAAGNKTPETTTQTCPPGSPNCAPATTPADTSSKPPDQSAGQAGGSKTPDPSASTPGGAEVKNGAGGSFMVQVAAVSKQEDAEILKNALQKKQYPVFIANSAGDPLFHVQVGPFSEKKDADAMRARLAGDGYNAIVK